MFIVSLAVADLIVGLIVMPMSTIYIFTGSWPFGVAVCQIWIGIDYTASTASILNLFILSLDRYWSVRAPLQYLHKRTRKRALSMISLVWVVSSLWVIPIAGWHYFAHGGHRTVPPDVCDTEYAKDSVFKAVTAFFNFYLPLSVMYTLYIRIFIEIRKRSEFELGQRIPGRKRLSYHVKTNPGLSHDDRDSDQGDDTFSEDHLTRMTYHDGQIVALQQIQYCGGGSSSSSMDSNNRVRQNGARTKPHSGTRTLRLPTSRRPVLSAREAPSPLMSTSVRTGPRKVEYIYDENVLDPQTEKLERYFYEDHVTRRCLPLSRTMLSGDRHRTPYRGAAGFATCPGSFTGGNLEHDEQEAVKLRGTCRSSSSGVLDDVMYKRINSSSCIRFAFGTVDAHPTKLKPVDFVDIVPTSLGRELRSKSACGSSMMGMGREDGLFRTDDSASTTPTSSSGSTFDDGRRGGAYRHQNHSESFTLVSGLRRMRLAETLAEQTLASDTGVSDRCLGSDNDDASDSDCKGDIFVLRDDRDRRLTGPMINLRHRIKNFRVSSFLTKEIKAARQLGVIMGAFTLCFLPYFILFLVVAFCDDCIEPGLLTAATWVGYLNSTLNPFLYPLCNITFRRKFRSMLQRRSSSSATHHSCYDRNSMSRARYD